MKKAISLLCSITILITSISISFIGYAEPSISVDSVVENLSQLYENEEKSGKDIEVSAESRVIVKANKKPDTYGHPEFVKGTGKIYIYQYSDITSATEAINYYNSLNFVEWAETDGIVEGQSLSYGNDMLGSDEAKEYIVNNNIELKEVKVALIDTGIALSGGTYNEYKNRIIDSGYNFSDSGTEGTAKADNVHGPKIASILLDNTSDNVKVVGYKASNKNNKGSNSALALAIEQATNDKVDIISLSLSGTTPSELLADSIRNAVNHNIVVVCAAGNSSDDVSKYYPANMDEVFTVGSIDKNGNRAFFSNFGEEIDFVAPGHYIEAKATDSVTKEMGTSFSVPFIDAVAAMVLGTSPDLTVDQVKQRLISSCVSMSDLAYHDGFHAIAEYDYEYTGLNSYKTYFATDDPETDEECFGYGMPQILTAMNICSQNSPVNFSVSSDTYHNSFTLVLSADNNAEIYYTTDESYPSKNTGELYDGPITIDETTSIRAIAYSDDKSKSIPKAMKYKLEYFADENDFDITDDGLITGYYGSLNEIIVPETINGITVTGIASYGLDNSETIGIVLPDTATTLCDEAVNADSLKFFRGNGITNIGESALNTDELISLEIPNVESVGENAVFGKLYEINFPKLKKAGELAFSYNDYLHSVNLPMLEAVPYGLFAYCSTLRTVNIDSAEYIENAAFTHCYRLKNIYANSLKEVTAVMYSDNDSAFCKCVNLTHLTDHNFPNLIKIGIKAFENCSNLDLIDLSNVEFVFNNAFSRTALTTVNLPKCKFVYDCAFEITPYLKSITLPAAEYIGEGAFRASALECIYAPELTEIGAYAFSAFDTMNQIYHENPSFKSIYAPKLAHLNEKSFAYACGTDTLELPSLETFDDNAFYESTIKHIIAPKIVCDKGASIRTADRGFRFGFYYNDCGKSIDEYGFLYSYSELNDFKYDTIGIKKKIANNRITHDDGKISFNLVFTGVPKNAYNDIISARAYVMTDGIYLYSNILNRSFGGVVNAILKDDIIDDSVKQDVKSLL